MNETYTRRYLRILLLIIGAVIICVNIYWIYTRQVDHAITMSHKNIELLTLQSHVDKLNEKLSAYNAGSDESSDVFSSSSAGDKLANLQNRLVSIENTLATARVDASLNALYDEKDGLVSEITSCFDASLSDPLWLDGVSGGTWVFMSNYNSSSKIIPSLWVCSVSDNVIGYAVADYNADSGLFENFKAYYVGPGSLLSMLSGGVGNE